MKDTNCNKLDIINSLKQYDTPTICNAIEIIKGGRQNTGFTQGQVVCTESQLPPIVGYAKTAKISGRQPTTQSPAEVLQMRIAYHTYMGAGMGASIGKAPDERSRPAVAVLEDLDYPSPIACFWGEINMAVHKGLGFEGVLTSGLMRDLDAMEKGMQIIAAGVGVSHAFVTVKEIDTEVDVMGLKVKPDQLIHADRHGAVVIDDEQMLTELPAAIQTIIDKEKIVLDAAKANDFSSESLNQAWLKFVGK